MPRRRAARERLFSALQSFRDQIALDRVELSEPNFHII
jgi:hypothetical protein